MRVTVDTCRPLCLGHVFALARIEGLDIFSEVLEHLVATKFQRWGEVAVLHRECGIEDAELADGFSLEDRKSVV